MLRQYIKVYEILLITAGFIIKCEPKNILAFPWFPGYSHFIIIEPLLKELARKGHNVTVISHFPQKTPVKNYHDIDISHTYPLVTNNITIDYMLENMRQPLDFMNFVNRIGYSTCKAAFTDDQLKNLANSKTDKFDLVITEVFGADCFVAFAHKFEAPLISIVTTIAVPWAYKRMANPDNPAYVTNYFLPVKEDMSLYERFYNAFIRNVANIRYYYSSQLTQHELMKNYFGESLPPLDEIVQNTRVMMTNSHFSFRQVQPFLPNFVEIGGIHLKEPKALPQDLQKIFDDSPNGVILISFGSMLRFSTLPEKFIKIFIKTFEKLPYTVVWKMEDSISGLPPNVLTKKWLPIKDALEHPNTKLIITHGGMATTIETIHAAVPVVGIPMYADQPGNIQSLVNKGAAVLLDYFEITEESFYDAINEVVENPSYREHVKKLSSLFKDRQQNPLDTAVYWTEYVLRHDGAPHLKCNALSLAWYELHLLDVIFVLLIITMFILYSIYWSLLILLNIFRKSKKNKLKKT